MNSVLEKTNGFQGTLSNIQLIDLLQMTCLSRISMNIRVEGEGKEGLIQVFNGNIVHAESNEKEGEAAFFEIMSWRGGQFQTFAMTDVPNPTIEKNWEFLLIEATKVQDEIGRLKESPVSSKDAEGDSLVRVLIVDDSRLICRKLKDLIETDPQLKVIGTAQNGKEALKKIKALNPDLITLDINMPVMSGDTALKHIMIQSPCPVLIVSSIDPKNMSRVMDFMRLGAVDFISKPKRTGDFEAEKKEFLRKIKVSAKAHVQNFKRCKISPQKEHEVKESFPLRVTDPLVVIVAGSGSYGELMKILPGLKPRSFGIIVALWQSELLLDSLGRFLNRYSGFDIVPLLNDNDHELYTGICYLCTLHQEIRLLNHNDRVVLQKGWKKLAWNETIRNFFENIHGIFVHGTKLVWVFLSGEKEVPGQIYNLITEKKPCVLVQDPGTALQPSLPGSLLAGNYDCLISPSEKLFQEINKLLES